MRYLSDSDVSQMMGIGYLGEVRQGPDGQLYQYVQGVDGLGNPVGGFWSRVKRGIKSFAKRALPIAQQFAPLIPIPGAAAALTAAAPFLRQAGFAGDDGIDGLYEAPDGNVYQVQGLADDDGMQGLGEAEINQMMGLGYIGEIRQGPDGNLYQFMQGMDGLGNIGGFWSKLRKLGRKALQYHPVKMALTAASPYIKKALPVIQQVASVIPGGQAAMTAAAPVLKEAGIGGCNCGQNYAGQPLQGFAGDDDLNGIDADDDLQGLDADEELQGFGDGGELYGFADDDDLRGMDADDDLNGFAADDDLQGFEDDMEMQGIDGYVRQSGMNGLDRYEPEQPPQTRWHSPPAQAPDVWKPLW